MLLVVDVGNTNIELGVFKEDTLLGTWRIVTKTMRTSDEYGIIMVALLESDNIHKEDIDGAIISSVVPNIMYSLTNSIRKYFHTEPAIIGPGTKTGITIHAENPKEVGADRICDLVGAYYLYGGPAIVVDFGTATTYDFITKEGIFNAAVTAPGIQISANALWTKAAKLPHIEIKKPPSILARNTITSMQAGLVYGYIGQVEYIVKKMKEETKCLDAKVVSTGGYAKVIMSETNVIDIHDPVLSLKGAKIIYEKNII